MKLGILKDFKGQHDFFVRACQDLSIDYEIIDFMSSNWMDSIIQSECDGFLVKPPGRKDTWKRMYDERLYFITEFLNKPIYPSYNEIFLFENKRNMAYWLQVNNIPHPKTWVFYDKDEAYHFANNYNEYPLFFKTNIGSAGVGVEIINNSRQLKKIIRKIFTKFNFYNKGYTKWNKKNGIPYPMLDDKQFDNILLQEKIEVKYEWRGVKIGESYFAHKKLEGTNGLHSGSGRADYSTPPKKIMDFIKYVCDKGNFSSMNVDFFEDYQGNLYVNELQTVFGSNIKPYQMLVNGKPGRFLFIDDVWTFEEGMFNQNNSYNLRVESFIKQLKI